jgi:sec-independent protein translocase protein TatB
MADLKKSFDEVKEAATGFTSGNVMTSLEKDVGNALRIDDIDKPAAAADTPAIDPPVTPTTPATSKVDAPEAPTPETSREADAHAAAMEPLAITREPAPDILKDAKAS